MTAFSELFTHSKPLIGVVHLPPLPGYPDSPGMNTLINKALNDLSACRSAGLDGILVENEYDRPHRLLATPEVTAAMTRITAACNGAAAAATGGNAPGARRCVVGCEILLNDPKASLAVAMASGARFIRTDYFVDPMVREGWGDMHIDPRAILDYRHAIGAEDILIFADIQVKYAQMTVQRTLVESAALAREKGADAIVVTGPATGNAPTADMLEEARQGAADLPVLIGSGLDPDNAGTLLSVCDGAIVGTALIRNGQIDPDRVRALVAARDAVTGR